MALNPRVKRLALVAVSVAILAWLWSKTGWADLGRALARLDPLWLTAAMLMFVPQTWISAVRWCWIVRAYQPLSTWRSTELVLASSSLNVVLPSKMGDVLKGAFLMKDRPGGDLGTGMSLGIFEKGTDTAMLAVVMLVASIFDPPTDGLSIFILASGFAGVIAFAVMLTPGVAGWLAGLSPPAPTPPALSPPDPTPLGLSPPDRRPLGLHTLEEPDALRSPANAGLAPGGPEGKRSGKLLRLLSRFGAVIRTLHADRGRFAAILAVSLFLWVLHMAQFSIAYVATGARGPEIALLWSRVPIAIFIGLLPISFAGIGTRDAAMVYLLKDRIGEDAALVLGVVATLRYLVVALAGLPFIPKLRRASPAPPAPAAPAR